ncbi:MAG: ZIP family metal transporter [Gammaproteobacteria bacterium]|nr:ZIP family metal transporter [Gammaproteobacteria bacterium]
MIPIEWWQTLAAAAAVVVLSLSGAFVLLFKPHRLRSLVPTLVSLAIGVLLGDAFLHLIPDSMARIGSLPLVGMLVLCGIVLFFVIEKFVRWRHDHTLHIAGEPAPPGVIARMNLVGDAVHNFTDGVLIAGSFAAGPAVGLTTTLAIIVHEIPQEIGDVGALIHGGYRPRRAVRVNFYVALTAIAGAMFGLALGHWADGAMAYLLPITAGGFIYIASADFIPSLRERSGLWEDSLQIGAIILGLACMLAITGVEDILQSAATPDVIGSAAEHQRLAMPDACDVPGGKLLSTW